MLTMYTTNVETFSICDSLVKNLFKKIPIGHIFKSQAVPEEGFS